MARNTQQVLGPDCNNPVAMVVCWTPDGADGKLIKTAVRTGGTGQAIRVAVGFGIPVFNLRNEENVEKLIDFVDSERYNVFQF